MIGFCLILFDIFAHEHWRWLGLGLAGLRVPSAQGISRAACAPYTIHHTPYTIHLLRKGPPVRELLHLESPLDGLGVLHLE